MDVQPLVDSVLPEADDVTNFVGKDLRAGARNRIETGFAEATDAVGYTSASAPVELVVTADVTSEGDVASAFARVIDELGTPWGVIHTVGTWDGGPLAQTSLEGWRHVLDLNLTSAFLCVRETARTMPEGRVIGIASRQGADRAPARMTHPRCTGRRRERKWWIQPKSIEIGHPNFHIDALVNHD